MADNFDNYGMKVQARVDLPSNKDIDAQIRKLEKSISKLKVSGQFDDTALKNLTNQLNTLKATVTTANFSPTALTELTNQVNKALQNINIGNINVGNTTSQAQQVGQQIGNAISQGINQSTSNVSQATGQILRDFSELNEAKRKFVDGENGKGQFFSEKEIADANKFYQTIRDAFKEFGQVTISKGEMTDGNLENLRVKIQQVNGELKTTREFMLYLNESTKGSGSFRLVDDDTIKTTESMVQHLNEAKNITNATGDEANALKQKLAEQEKYYDKLEQASKEQLAIEKQRITAGEKQLEVLDKQSKRRDSRKSYNEGQINKKGLTDTERQKEINDLVYAGNEKYDSAFAKEIDKSLSNLSDLKSKWKEQGIYVDEFKTKVESLETSLNGIDSGDVKGLNAIKQKMEELKTEANQLVDVNKIQLSMSTGGYESKVDSLIGKTQQWVDTNGNARISTDALQTAMNNLNTAYANITATGGNTVANQQALIQAEQALDVEVKKVQSSVTSMNATMAKSTAVDSLRQKVQMFYDTNTKSHRNYGVQLRAIVSELATGAEVPITKLRQLSQEFIGIQNAARRAGKLGLSFFDTLKQGMRSFSYWTSSTFLVMKAIQEVRQVITTVKELDNAMMDLTMATGYNRNQVEELMDTYFKLGEELSATATDVAASADTWLRQGKSIAETNELIKDSMILSKISGLSAEESTKYLTSAMKGYKVATEDVLGVVDKLSAVDMASATDVGGLAEGMSEVAASADLAGVSMDKLLGYLAIVGETTQSGMSEVGTSFNAIFARMGNIKLARLKDYQNNGEDLSNVETVLRGEGIVLRDSTDEFRNFGEVLDEVAGRWTSFSEVSQRAIASAFAG